MSITVILEAQTDKSLDGLSACLNGCMCVCVSMGLSRETKVVKWIQVMAFRDYLVHLCMCVCVLRVFDELMAVPTRPIWVAHDSVYAEMLSRKLASASVFHLASLEM